MTTRTITVCTITVHDQAPARDGLTVEIESDWVQAFIDALKDAMHPSDRAWVKETRRWHVSPECLESVCRLAAAHYDGAWLVTDGGRTRTNLHTGQVVTQASMF